MTVMQLTKKTTRRNTGIWLLPLLVGIPAFIAASLSISDLLRLLPTEFWWRAISNADFTDPRQLLYRHAFLPRLAISLLVGAALGLAGTLFQQILRNPLAEPTTIGTNAGASVALTLATLYAPWMLEHGREWVAIAGGTISTLIVFALASGRGFSPIRIIIGGLIVSLTFSSASAFLMAANREYSQELYIWQSGSLIQNGDATAFALAPWLLAGAAAAFLLVRPLQILDLADEGASSLGNNPTLTRMTGLAVAVILSAIATAAVGVISFVALAAPVLTRLAGARTLHQRVIWAPLLGASLLWLTDRVVQILPFVSEIPAGTATAFLGAPLLLLLLPKLRIAPHKNGDAPSVFRRRNGLPWLLTGLLVLGFFLCLSLAAGRDINGWYWATSDELGYLLPLRAPRVVVALSAGIMLAFAGVVIQRMTGNPIAAPEVLGISGAAALGVLLLFVSMASFSRPAMFLAGLAGALVSLLLIAPMGYRKALAPERLLLSGVAVATMASAASAIVLASGDPRLGILLAWLSGSTYTATADDAITAGIITAILVGIAPLTARWLEILPLGMAAARGVGLGVDQVRIILLVLIATATAASTLIIGPLSFVGLMAPHMARVLGFQRALPQLAAAGLLGGLMLMLADWAGRMLIFPWQIPAGLLAALVGGPYFIVLMRTRRS